MRSALASVVADVACVCLFVALGREAHQEGDALAGFLGTAAPFLIALAAAWLLVVALRWSAAGLPGGALVWFVTWALGLTLRGVVFHEGTAAAFVIVAATFLAVTMLGWRTAVLLVRRRRSSTGPAAVDA